MSALRHWFEQCKANKIRIVLDGLRGEMSIAELCRREGLAESMYYKWSKIGEQLTNPQTLVMNEGGFGGGRSPNLKKMALLSKKIL